MAQKAFFLDATRCTGCKTCEIACKDYHDLGVDYTYRRIFDYEGGEWNQASEGVWENSTLCITFSVSCNHCDNPACAKVCPTGAMHKDSDTGARLG